jgi:hypothetical protein
LNKEKKHLSENMAKASDDFANNQDKLNHLNDVKAKLEKTLDQMDGALESKCKISINFLALQNSSTMSTEIIMGKYFHEQYLVKGCPYMISWSCGKG